MLICSQCRFENPEENRFCQQCGAPLALDIGVEADAADSPTASATNRDSTGDLGAAPESFQSLAAASESPQTTTLIQLPQEAEPTPSNLEATPEETLVDGVDGVESVRGSELLDPMPSLAQTAPPTSPDPDPWEENSKESRLESNPLESSIDPTPADSLEPASDWHESDWEADEEDTAFGKGTGEDEDLPTMLLPMQLARLDSAGATHVGRQRDHNEDYFDTDTQLQYCESPVGKVAQARGLYILCDGMGGHSAGEVASATAVQQLKAYFKSHWQESLPDETCIRDAIFTANQAIFEINEENDSAGSGRMGTTLVLMLLQNTQVAIANVGDSRLYTYSRRRGLEQQTIDHEVGQSEVLRGVDPEVAYARPESYQLTQALGPKGNDYIDPEIQFLELNEDTIFLLCSDGLSDYGLLEEHAQGRIEPLLSSRASLEQGVGELINLANELSGHDNITAITIRAKVRPDVRTLRS